MSSPRDAGEEPGWVTLACLREDVDTARRKIEVLEAELVHARLIGMAVGMVMTRECISDSEAFEQLAERGRAEGRATWQIADDLLGRS